MTQTHHDDAFVELSERLITEHWDFYPTTGSRIGRHQYDGRLPDLSPDQTARRIREIRRGKQELQAFDDSTLDTENRLYFRMLDLFLERELFTFEEMRPLENNPMRQSGFLNMGNYVRRDYAPLEDRLRSATEALHQVPDFLSVVDSALRDDLSPHVVDMSVESYSGMAHFYRTDLAAFATGTSDSEISSDFTGAITVAASAIDEFVANLKSRANGGENAFAIGNRLYSRMLATGEGLDAPLDRIAAVGQANLDENLALIEAIAASIDPHKSVREIVDDISRTHPTADSLIPDTQELLEDIRQALIDHSVISLPSDDRCRVVETPAYMRYAFAAMDSAGALETRATESFYYVTPVEEHWTAHAGRGVALQVRLQHPPHHLHPRGVSRPLRPQPPQPLRPAAPSDRPRRHVLRLFRGLGPLHRADDGRNRLRQRAAATPPHPASRGPCPQLPLHVLHRHAHRRNDR